MPRPLICPRCNGRINRQHLKDWECPHCHTDIGLARSYQQIVALITLILTSLLAVMTHKSSSSGAWLLIIFASAISIWFILIIALPPWLKQGRSQPRITLVSAWLGAALSVFIVEFLLFGSAHVLLGATRSELTEHLEMLSIPLAWMSTNFLITPERSSIDVCIFFGSAIYAFYQPVRWAFRRARPTQLSLSTSNSAEEDD